MAELFPRRPRVFSGCFIEAVMLVRFRGAMGYHQFQFPEWRVSVFGIFLCPEMNSRNIETALLIEAESECVIIGCN